MTTSPGASVGTRHWPTQAVKASPLIGPSRTKGATMPSWRNPARKVSVFPVSVRDVRCQSLALRRRAAGPGHVGLDPGFIYEDQTLGIKLVLMRPPSCPETCHLRTHLLSGHQGLFLTVCPARFTNRQTVSCATCTPRAASSNVSARIVRSGFSASRASNQPALSPASTARRLPPILPGTCPRPRELAHGPSAAAARSGPQTPPKPRTASQLPEPSRLAPTPLQRAFEGLSKVVPP